jgi:hypothetical protein
MAAIFMEGFDKYGGVNSNAAGVQALLQAGEWSTATSGLTIVAGLSATGFAVSIPVSAGVLSKTLVGNYGRLIGGVRINAASLTQVCGIQFADAATNQCGIRINSTTGTFSVINGNYSSGTVLGTSTASITSGPTHYLEWDITFSNTGAYQLWLDGVSILSGSGDTTGSANNYANVFQFVCANSAVAPVFDDFYLFDTSGTTNNAVLITSPRIETTFPASDSAVQFGFGAGILGSSAARVTTTNAPAAASLVLRRFTPAAACTLNSVTIMPGATNGTANYRGVVYGDTAGAPGTLLSSGTQITGVTSGTAATLPLTTPQSLSAGTQYWIGFINDTSVALAQSDGSNAGYRAANTYASGAPGTAPAMTGGQATWLIWGNLAGVAVNYDEVNNQPPDGQYSYVFDATVNHEDLYGFGALSVTPASVYAVAVKGYVQRSDSGAKTISLRTKSGASDSGGSLAGQTPATTYGWMASVFETDPATGAAWTGANLNAATSGIRVDS